MKKILILLSLVLISFFIIGCTPKIATFDECIAAGYPVLESYPRQCKAEGFTFIEEIPSCECPEGYVQEKEVCNPECYYNEPACMTPSITCNSADAQIANPASVYCEEQGGVLEIRTAVGGSQLGYCTLPGGVECEEWAYYRGECPVR